MFLRLLSPVFLYVLFLLFVGPFLFCLGLFALLLVWFVWFAVWFGLFGLVWFGLGLACLVWFAFGLACLVWLARKDNQEETQRESQRKYPTGQKIGISYFLVWPFLTAGVGGTGQRSQLIGRQFCLFLIAGPQYPNQPINLP